MSGESQDSLNLDGNDLELELVLRESMSIQQMEADLQSLQQMNINFEAMDQAMEKYLEEKKQCFQFQDAGKERQAVLVFSVYLYEIHKKMITLHQNANYNVGGSPMSQIQKDFICEIFTEIFFEKMKKIKEYSVIERIFQLAEERFF